MELVEPMRTRVNKRELEEEDHLLEPEYFEANKVDLGPQIKKPKKKKNEMVWWLGGYCVIFLITAVLSFFVLANFAMHWFTRTHELVLEDGTAVYLPYKYKDDINKARNHGPPSQILSYLYLGSVHNAYSLSTLIVSILSQSSLNGNSTLTVIVQLEKQYNACP
jgi:hypothetical protein